MFDNLFGLAGTTMTAAALFLLLVTCTLTVSLLSRSLPPTAGRYSRPRI